MANLRDIRRRLMRNMDVEKLISKLSEIKDPKTQITFEGINPEDEEKVIDAAIQNCEKPHGIGVDAGWIKIKPPEDK
ncbi:MAG: hypothetical protein F6K62_12230 [Sphaerospermopsis sp. SIO1G2]|nr:hypothetical protein [Sphaerospermopsis sp. SIO1G2]